MVWGDGGLLAKAGALDFAGGLVVHTCSSVSALVLSLLLGKRVLTSGGPLLRPHNLPMTLTEAFLLWFGWFGFNAGSAVASNDLAVNAFMVTHLAAATAALTWALIEWITFKQPTAVGFASGAVIGLVAITPASGYVGPLSAILIGAVAALLGYMATRIKGIVKADDTLDVFAVHGVGGLWGTLIGRPIRQPRHKPGWARSVLRRWAWSARVAVIRGGGYDSSQRGRHRGNRPDIEADSRIACHRRRGGGWA